MAKKTAVEAAASRQKAEVTTASAFSKEQLLQARRYCEQRDLLCVLLVENQLYTHAAVLELLENFQKGKPTELA